MRHKAQLIDDEKEHQHIDKVVRLHAVIAWFYNRSTDLQFTVDYVISRSVASAIGGLVVEAWFKDAKQVVKKAKGKVVKILVTGLGQLNEQWPKLTKVSKEDRVKVWGQLFDLDPLYTC